MTRATDMIKKAGGVIGAGRAAYDLAVTVEGAPIREKTQPAAVKILGLTIFRRDETLDRTWFGFIKRGKSKVAKRYLDAGTQPAEQPDVQPSGNPDA